MTMQRQRLRTLGMVSLLSMGFTISALSLTSSGDCDDYQHGCSIHLPVPCQTTTCADMSGYPAGHDTSCSPYFALRFSSHTSLTDWTVCEENLATTGSGITKKFVYSNCNNNNGKICGTLTKYKSVSCTAENVCGTADFTSACGSSGDTADCNP